MWKASISWLVGWRGRRAAERDLADELSFHVHERAEHLQRLGLTAGEAERRARVELGGRERYADDVRDLLRGRWLESAWRGLLQACRALRRAPGYCAATVLVYAFAMATGSAIFSAVHAILLRPTPIRAADELVVGWERNQTRNQAVVELSYRNIQDWRSSSRTLDDVAAFGASAWALTLEEGETAIRLATVGVTWTFFETLGVRPLLGRFLEASDEQPSPERPLVLSHRMWQARFGGDATIVGARLVTGDGPAIVVGVAPPGLDFPSGVDAWLPAGPVLAGVTGVGGSGDAIDGFRDVGVLFLVGRLRPEASVAAAAADLDRVATDAAAAGAQRFGTSVAVVPFLDYHLGPARSALRWLSVGVVVLLAIAFGNAVALTLARAVRRQREQAVRVALGASRVMVWRQWLLESLLMALMGCAGGAVAAGWLVAAIRALAPDDLPHAADISLSGPVLVVSAALVVATAIMGGVIPATLGSTRGLARALAEGGRATDGRRTRRIWGVLLTSQIALSVALLMVAVVVIRSYGHLRQVELGFRPEGVMALEVDSRRSGHAHNEWLRPLLQQVESLPNVAAAGAVHLRPLLFGAVGSDSTIVLEGQPLQSSSGRLNPLVNTESATPGYFSAMGIRLLEGRLFDDSDDADSPRVAVVSRSAARALWPGRSAVGQRFSRPELSQRAGAGGWRSVVGVVEDVRYRGLTDVRLDVYEPASQSDLRAGSLLVRTRANGVGVATAVASEVRRLEPRAIVSDITTMTAVVERATATWTLSAWMLGLFAIVAWVLVGIALFSAVSLDSTRRAQEFALRLALGAGAFQVVRAAASETVARVLLGTALGLIAGTLATSTMANLLFEVSPFEAATPTVVGGLVAAIVVAATALPIARAVRVSPASLLKLD